MEDSITIVLENPAILSGVCGANDDNLRVIERALGGIISTRGNELRFSSADRAVSGLFKQIIEHLIVAVEEGEQPSPEYVRTLTATVIEGPERALSVDPLREAAIVIPSGFGRVYPRSINQARYVQALRTHDVVFCVGPAGTGKTFLAVAEALRQVLSKKRRKLVLTRPVVEAGESLGFLPGDLAQKINPYLRPLYDAMEALIPYDTIRRMEESRIIEIAPLAYMRGRSLNDCIIILDEAQNTTREQMKMFLTRIGEGSQAVITGDTTQIDLPRRSDSGLLHAISILHDVEGLYFAYLNTGDVVRNPLIKKIIQAYENDHS
ncbi:MAG TPA: PhoH family protein [Termitinemataceae bacterium]|nr:PhoH family protein [Termitinemataceae bacterium]HOM22717.1 PhoH family protein [Termitinemataceae bacterium]HPQ00833.1 PhoH family protein [Termitinemataceae bacterium]